MLYLQKELKNKGNMIQCLLTKLSNQTEFMQKQNYELQRELLVNRNSIYSLKTTISVTITTIISLRITETKIENTEFYIKTIRYLLLKNLT